MGLSVSHDCWYGSYKAFHTWRRALAAAIGISLDEMEGYGELGKGTPWEKYPYDALFMLLCHSDCDGTIEGKDQLALADRLEMLAAGGSLAPWVAQAALRFAEGLRFAFGVSEAVDFA